MFTNVAMIAWFNTAVNYRRMEEEKREREVRKACIKDRRPLWCLRNKCFVRDGVKGKERGFTHGREYKREELN